MRLTGVAMLAMLGAAPMAMRAIAAGSPPRVAVFPLELEDTSGEGPRPEQERRLHMLDSELLARLADSGRYAPVAASLPEGSPALRNCPRCELPVAERLEAGLALRGVVHKVSNLIL